MTNTATQSAENILLITAVAIRLPNGRIVSAAAPARHCDLPDQNALGIRGFLCSDGRFVDRSEGRLVAEAAGQLLASAMLSKWLFAEDLW